MAMILTTFKNLAKNGLTALALVSMSLAPLMVQAEAPQCSELFSSQDAVTSLSAQELEVVARATLGSEYEKYAAWSQKAVILSMKSKILKKIKTECTASACTDRDVARLVESSIVESFQKVDLYKSRMRRIRGSAILVGIAVGIAVTSHLVTGHLTAADQWLSNFITIATSVGLYAVGAPLWNTLSTMSRGAFRLKDGKSFFRQDEEEARYQDLYHELQKKLTANEQVVTSRITGLLNSTESTFGAAIESIQSKDPSKGGIERASARIALAAIKYRKFFPELPPDDPDLNMAVKMLFTQFLPQDETREKLYMQVMAQIEMNDAVAFSSPQTAAIYRQMIRRWSGLE